MKKTVVVANAGNEIERLRKAVYDAICVFAEKAPKVRAAIEVNVGDPVNGSDDVISLLWKKDDASFWVFIERANGRYEAAQTAPVHILIEIPKALPRLLQAAHLMQEKQFDRLRDAQREAFEFMEREGAVGGE